MKTLGVIPARLESTRLPRKLLLSETGRTLLEHTHARACSASSLDAVVVATDSLEIAAAVKRFGGSVVMTGACDSGTDRVAAVARDHAADVYVNIQGDEPEIDPASIDRLVEALEQDPACGMATLSAPLADVAEWRDPGNVKLVAAATGRALYFSRAPVPHDRDAPGEAVPDAARLHVGVYAYRRDFLLSFPDLPVSRLERTERLEQWRALEAGVGIAVAEVPAHAVGVDTRADYDAFVAREASRGLRRAA